MDNTLDQRQLIERHRQRFAAEYASGTEPALHPYQCGPCEECAEFLREHRRPSSVVPMFDQPRRRWSSLPAPTLAQFIHHAERLGVAFVYETAESYLGERDLRRLRIELDTIEAQRHAKLQKRYDDAKRPDAIKRRHSDLKRTTRRRRSRVETQVAAQVLADDGLTRLEIAEKLGVTVKTIDNLLSPAAAKTTETLRSSVRGIKSPANKGVPEPKDGLFSLGSTMRFGEEAESA